MPSDAEIRQAELVAYSELGLAPREVWHEIGEAERPVAVRTLEFGPDGSDTPPVVLLHGVASASVLFAPLLPALEGRRVVVVDWPGHGLSGPVRVAPGPGVRRHADAVLSGLFDSVGADEFDLVGHSLGAQFSLYAAADMPERVRRVVTLGAPGAGLHGVRPIAPMKLMAVPRLGQLLLRLPTTEPQFRRSAAMAMGPGVIEQQSAALQRAARLMGSRSANASSIASMFRALIAGSHVRPGVALTADDLACLSAPVLMLWGEHDVFMAPDQAHAAIGTIPQVELVCMETGHAPWLERLGLVAVRTAGFLDVATRHD